MNWIRVAGNLFLAVSFCLLASCATLTEPTRDAHALCSTDPEQWHSISPPDNALELLALVGLGKRNEDQSRLYWFQGNSTSLMLCRPATAKGRLPACGMHGWRFIKVADTWTLDELQILVVCG